MKRIFLLLLAVCLTIMAVPINASAAAAAVKNTELKAITVKVPYFPDLEITMTNVPHLCGEFNVIEGVLHQVKFYYGKNTTISFNRDITMGLDVKGMGMVNFKAGQPIKASSFNTGTLTAVLIVSSDGSYTVSNNANMSMTAGQKAYMLTFIEVSRYEGNIAEGYSFTDINDWAVAPKTDANTKVIPVDYDGDGSADFTYSISGISKTAKVKIADVSRLKDKENPSLAAIARKDINMYTIKARQKIFVPGALDCFVMPMQYKSKLLYDKYGPDEDYDAKEFMTASIVRAPKIDLGSGFSYAPYDEGTYASFIKEGYYLFSVLPYVPHHYVTDITREDWGEVIDANMFKYNAVVLHVVK